MLTLHIVDLLYRGMDRSSRRGCTGGAVQWAGMSGMRTLGWRDLDLYFGLECLEY